MPLTLEPRKPQNRDALLMDLGGDQREKNQEGIKHTSPTKSQRERPRIHHNKFAKKGLRKSPKRRNRKYTSKP
jgi:hypothetical protein